MCIFFILLFLSAYCLYKMVHIIYIPKSIEITWIPSLCYRGRCKIYLFEWPFLVLIKIKLQFNYCNLGFWLCSKSPNWSSSLLQASTISAIKKGQICRKSTFSHLFNIFLRKYCHLLSSCSQHLWSPKQCKVHNFPRPAFQELLNVITHKHFMKYNPFDL